MKPKALRNTKDTRNAYQNPSLWKINHAWKKSSLHFPFAQAPGEVSGCSSKPGLATSTTRSCCDWKGQPECIQSAHPSSGTAKETGWDVLVTTTAKGNKMQCYPLQNPCSMCNCHQTELSDQPSKSVTPSLRTKKKLLQETAENKAQSVVTFH